MNSLRVLTLNIEQMPFPLGSGSRNKRARILSDIILSNDDFDVICFQELFRRSARKILIKQLKNVYPYYCIDDSYGKYLIGVNSGLGIFSRFPIVDNILHTFKNYRGVENFAKKGVMGTRIDISSLDTEIPFDIYVFTTHIQSGIGNEPCICGIFNKISGSPGSDMSSVELKKSQMEEVADTIENFCERRENVILAGDLNIVAQNNNDYAFLKDIMNSVGLSDTFDSNQSSLQSTVIGEQNRRIDYIWSDMEGSSVISAKYGNTDTTDHRDVIGEFELE